MRLGRAGGGLSPHGKGRGLKKGTLFFFPGKQLAARTLATLGDPPWEPGRLSEQLSIFPIQPDS